METNDSPEIPDGGGEGGGGDIRHPRPPFGGFKMCAQFSRQKRITVETGNAPLLWQVLFFALTAIIYATEIFL